MIRHSRTRLRVPRPSSPRSRTAAPAFVLVLLALGLGPTFEEAEIVESAGRVHDLGKVVVDPVALTKVGKLDAAEWAEMRRHPVLGADVVAGFAAYRDGQLLVRHHHEAWDGSGYPDRLAGEAIPLGARILAVADTYDALTSARSYRGAMGRDAALAILRDGSGRQWDPVVVDAMVAHLPTVAMSNDVPLEIDQDEMAA